MVGHAMHSLVLAQLFGLYLVIMAVVFASRASYYRALVQKLKPDMGLTISATYGLLLGLFLVIIHNTWVLGPEIFITIIAWIVLLKSLFWLGMPERMLRMTQKLFASHFYYVVMLITGLIGVILMANGFYLFMR